MCEICGYDKCQEALQFHHYDSNEKKFGISHKGLTKSYSKLTEEANKCILLYANCHAEVENFITVIPEFF